MRIGSGRNGADEIKNHRFFRPIDWIKLQDKLVTPPFIPKTQNESDVQNIDKDFTEEMPQETPDCDNILL
jgi:hypothetical protein